MHAKKQLWKKNILLFTLKGQKSAEKSHSQNTIWMAANINMSLFRRDKIKTLSKNSTKNQKISKIKFGKINSRVYV